MKLSSLSNLLARSFIVFILAYLWLGFYLDSLIVVFLLSFCIMLMVNYLVVLFGRRKNARVALTKKQQQHMREVMLQLKFMSKIKTMELFGKAFETRYKVKATQKKLIITALEAPANGEEVVKINFFPMFNSAVTTADVAACIKATTKDAATYIAAESFTPEVIAFAATIDRDVKLMDGAAVYTQVLSPAEMFPEINVEFKTRKKLRWSDLRQIVFQRAKVRPYIIMGIIILMTSFIVQFNIYYILMATVLFSFALVSLFAVPSRNEFF